MMTPAAGSDLRRYNAATAHLEPPFAVIELHLIDGDMITATVPAYRGEGKAFL
jgi:hypothetical protein